MTDLTIKRYCFDIDGTICTQTYNQEYHKAKPYKDMIDVINALYDQGHCIIISTARGKSSGKDFRKFTVDQLAEWGVKYHEIHFDKPSADYYIDDKAFKIGQIVQVFKIK